MAAEQEFDYPGFFDAAGDASLAGQRRYMGFVGFRAGALVLAAVGGAVNWTVSDVEVLAWAALVAFVVALAVEVLIYALAPDQVWYEGRAAAESVKTLSWRYCVGGDPFPVDLREQDSDVLFLAQLNAVSRDLTHIPPPAASVSHEITEFMQNSRRSSFDARRDIYRVGRVEDQINWYGRKARINERNRQLFLVLTIVLEFLGVLAAALRAVDIIDFDLLGIIAALVAGFATWSQTRQYGQLARSYSIAAHELNSIRSELLACPETSWARFVDEAEEAISREHTLWRASRGVLSQRRQSP